MSARSFARPALTIFAGGLGLGLGVAVPLLLAAGPVPNSFSDGTVASAAAVNQNFGSVTDRLDTLEGRVQILKTQFHEVVGNTALGTPNIPFDNTIPQIGEGAKVFEVTFTPTQVGSTVVVESVVHLATNRSGGDNYTTSLFVNGAANAVRSAIVWGNQERAEPVVLRHQFTTTSTAPLTLRLNAGGNASATTWLNAHTASDYGGTVGSWLTITERR